MIGWSAMEIGAASSCSKEHQKIYHEWFALANSDGDGRITGPDAIKFFGMSRLPHAHLKQVWAIADSKRLGYLGFGEFVTSMQLVSLAQAGNEINQDRIKREDLSSLNPPVMEGLDTLLAKSKHLVKRVDQDIDGFPQAQGPSTNHWFTSKSSKKRPRPAIAWTDSIAPTSTSPPPPCTDSHSLAERVRRERITQRMKFLQDLVPGCNKVIGKPLMLDEIIDYVQSLQRQVEFLSMKLATLNPLDFSSLPSLLHKDVDKDINLEDQCT